MEVRGALAFDGVTAFGCSCLGFLIGIMVHSYVWDAKQMSYQVLAGSVSILAGSGVLAIFHLIGGKGATPREYWFYPVGLLAGYLGSLFVHAQIDHYNFIMAHTKL